MWRRAGIDGPRRGDTSAVSTTSARLADQVVDRLHDVTADE
jgi:hypothetical protein